MIAPKIRPQGGYRPFGIQVKARPGTDVRARLWKAMRVKRRFTIGELMTITDAQRGNAQDYCQKLRDTGFINMVAKGNASARRMAVFQLVRDTGPLAPITSKNGTAFDQNTRTTYLKGGAPREEPRGDDD